MKNYKFLEWGYKAAIFLSLFALLASSAFLFYYLFKSNPEKINAMTMAAYSSERRMVLLSTAIFVAMAFGFLGFALFLIQAHGEVSGSIEYKDSKVNIARMSPGIFVVLCATVIIIFALNVKISYSQPLYEKEVKKNPEVTEKKASVGDPKDDPYPTNF